MRFSVARPASPMRVGLGVEQAAGALERGLLAGFAGDLEDAAADLEDELGHVRPPRSGA